MSISFKQKIKRKQNEAKGEKIRFQPDQKSEELIKFRVTKKAMSQTNRGQTKLYVCVLVAQLKTRTLSV